MSRDYKYYVRWAAIYLFFLAAPAYIFKIAGKLLRPVADVIEEMVSTVEDMGDG